LFVKAFTHSDVMKNRSEGTSSVDQSTSECDIVLLYEKFPAFQGTILSSSLGSVSPRN